MAPPRKRWWFANAPKIAFVEGRPGRSPAGRGCAPRRRARSPRRSPRGGSAPAPRLSGHRRAPRSRRPFGRGRRRTVDNRTCVPSLPGCPRSQGCLWAREVSSCCAVTAFAPWEALGRSPRASGSRWRTQRRGAGRPEESGLSAPAPPVRRQRVLGAGLRHVARLHRADQVLEDLDERRRRVRGVPERERPAREVLRRAGDNGLHVRQGSRLGSGR